MQRLRSTLVALIALLASLGFAGLAEAQSGQCRLVADRESIGIDQVVRLEVQCEVQGAAAGMPELDGVDAFQVVSRQFSRPMQFSFGVGGQQQFVQSSSRLSLALRPTREGRFELGPARVEAGGHSIESNRITLTVGAAGTGRIAGNGGVSAPVDPGVQSPASPSTAPPSGPLDGAVYDDMAFLRTVVDRREAVVGQQVVVTFYLYVRQLATQPQIVQQPSTDGFWVHDLVDRNAPPDPSLQRVGNTTFRVYTLRRVAAFPLRAGTLTIGAMEMRVPVGNPLDMIFGGSQADLARTSVPVSIEVREPEGNHDASLPTHVGSLAATATLDRSQVPTGDAVSLDVRLEGTGHVESLETPSLAIDGLRVLQPEVDQHTTVQSEVVGGTKSVRWLIVPERPGTYTIPAFAWSVYDPQTHAWTVTRTQPLTLVAAGNAITAPSTSAGTDTEPAEDDVEAPSGDETAAFGPVRTESAFVRRAQPLASSPLYAGLLALGPLGLFAAASLWFARRRAASQGAASAGKQLARDARRRLADAEKAIAARDTRAFYGAAMQALKLTIEARLDKPIGSLTHAELRRVLVARGMASELAKRVAEELEGAEMARFSAAGGEESEMRAALARGRELVAELERFQPTEDAS